MADCTPCAFWCGKTTHNSECFQVPTNLTARSFQGNALFLLHVLQCRRPMSFTSLAARFLKFAGSRPSLSLQQRHIQNLNDGTRVQHPDMACEGMPSLVHILTLPAPSRRPGDRLAVPGANATGGGAFILSLCSCGRELLPRRPPVRRVPALYSEDTAATSWLLRPRHSIGPTGEAPPERL
jgi:hypothetical protein